MKVFSLLLNFSHREILRICTAVSAFFQKIRQMSVKIISCKFGISDEIILPFVNSETNERVESISTDFLGTGGVQKLLNLIDLVKSFPTKSWLRKSSSIRPRTRYTPCCVSHRWSRRRLLFQRCTTSVFPGFSAFLLLLLIVPADEIGHTGGTTQAPYNVTRYLQS